MFSTFGIIISITLITLANADNGQAITSGGKGPALEGKLTVHEKLGQVHFPGIEFEEFKSEAHYSKPRAFSGLGMDRIYNFTHTISTFLHPQNASYMIPDYVKHTNKTSYNIGKKYEENDWVMLLDENLILIIFWLLPLMFLAITMPFIGVIYFCFCCWRCKKTCGPCNRASNLRRRFICSILLFLLIIVLLLALILALLSLKQMSRNCGYTRERVREATRDACIYLKDVSEHLHFLMVHNFQKLAEHINDELSNAHNHVLLDLVDTSGANALSELERILLNMKPTIRYMKMLDENEKYLRFIGALHRDVWRGLKRDFVLLLVTLCPLDSCFWKLREMQRLDTSHCLHIDEMPNTTKFMKPIEDAIEKELFRFAQNGIQRIQVVQNLIKDAIQPIVPPIQRMLSRSSGNLRDEYIYLLDIINAVITEIHFRDRNTADTFEDINERFGADRMAYGSIACIAIFLVLITLIFGLVLGLLARRTGIGSTCLIIAIILIFCIFSFITLLGLFYYMLGTVTYQAVCARLDSLADYESRSVRMVDRISACKPDQHIYDLLAEYKLYDIERIMAPDKSSSEDGDAARWDKFSGDLSKFKILTLKEVDLLNDTLLDLYAYNSKSYTENVCKSLRTPSIDYNLSQDMWDFLNQSILYPHHCDFDFTQICVMGNVIAVEIHKARTLDPKIIRSIDAIHELTDKINSLILGSYPNLGEAITSITKRITRSEKFFAESGENYINTIGNNLTESLKEALEDYRYHTHTRIKYTVGPCGPLIYYLDRGTKTVCHQLVDPINGFWVGLLLSSLLFIPLLFVAHSLICLYRPPRVKYPVVYLVRNDECPSCTGAPYVPPPIVVSGGQERDWDAIDIEAVESKNKLD